MKRLLVLFVLFASAIGLPLKSVDSAEVAVITDCGGTFNTKVGSITSKNYPDNYGNNFNCTYIITSPFNGIYLHFYDLITEATHDVVSVYENSLSGKLLFTFSGSTTASWSGKVFKSTTTKMVINFVTDASVVQRGFFARFSQKDDLCNVGGFVGSAKTIVSPSYPANYQNDLICDFYVKGTSSSKKPSVTFDDFNVEENHDYVTLFNGVSDTAPVLAKVSGTTLPQKTYTATQQYMLVRFTSDFAIVRPGFSASVTV